MNIQQTNPNVKAVVLYDGTCPLCQKSVSILKRLDWLRRLSYHDARDTDQLPETPVKLDAEKMLQEMHVLTPDRQRAYAGFRAFRWIAGRLPILWAFWPLMFVPGVPWLGNRVYRWVARNRYNLVPCHDGQCAVPLRPPADKTKTVKGTS
ncbi:MAG: DUF393 domain-containing protein [Planctomycetes bacterium]|nr:DUF393 domain-containing protein [Planctomycetota bacterium]